MILLVDGQSARSGSTFAEAERDHILEVLKETAGLIGGSEGAAARLGLPRTTLIYKMRKLGIETRRTQRKFAMPPDAFVADNMAAAFAGSY